MGSDYEAPKEGAVGKGRNLRDRLKDENVEGQRRVDHQQWREQLEERIHRSGTRKVIDGFFFVAYIAVGLDFLLRLFEQQSFIAMVGIVPAIFCMPLKMAWKPDPEMWNVGTLHVYKIQLVTLIICAVLHLVLKTAHRAMIIERFRAK